MAAQQNLAQNIVSAAGEFGFVDVRVILADREDGWSASVVTNDATLMLDVSREGFVASIERPGQRLVVVDEPRNWGMFYPEDKKIRFYLGVFRAYVEGQLSERLYDPRTPNQPLQRNAGSRPSSDGSSN